MFEPSAQRSFCCPLLRNNLQRPCVVARVKRVRDKYEAELRELEQSERVAVEKQQDLRRRQVETEAELIRLQAALRQKEEENEDVTQVRSPFSSLCVQRYSQ